MYFFLVYQFLDEQKTVAKKKKAKKLRMGH